MKKEITNPPANQWEPFFKALYDGTEHEIELRALPSCKQLFTNWDNTAQIEGFIKGNITQNLYFGVCTREGQKGDKEATRELTTLWTDIDFKDFSGGEEEAREFLGKTLNIPTTAVVHTGNGLHLYWIFKEAEAARPEVEAYLKGLAKRLRGDKKAAELARILRIPGTFNYKDGGKKPVRLIKLDSNLRYNLSDFEDLKDDTPANDAVAHTVNVQEITDRCAFLKYCHNNRATLTEPLWYAMVSNVARISPGGPDLVHALSQGHPGYSRSETDQKILHSLNGAGPHTCQNIKDTMKGCIGKDCGKDCHVKAPIALFGGKANKEVTEQAVQKVKGIGIADFLSLEFPPRENILDPWLPMQGLCMIHAPRGIGKTFLSLNIAVAVASGGQFLRWRAPQERGVLLLDGEMPGIVLQERLSYIIASVDDEPTAPLTIITPDLQPSGMPNLIELEGQEAIEPYLKDISLVIVDNISTLCRGGRENEGESWLPVQEWALKLRSRGISVLFIHHSGKAGQQRGTSRREDVLDTVISLKHPAEYRPDMGACFEVHFEKSRGIYGDVVKPFEAKMETHGGKYIWTLKDLEESLTDKVAELMKEGIPQHEIAELLGKAKGTISKHVKKAKMNGVS